MHISAGPVTISSLELFPEVSADERMPVAHFNVSSSRVVVPTSAAITYSETFQVGNEGVSNILVGYDVLVHFPSKIGHINSSVRLTTNVQIISLEFGE